MPNGQNSQPTQMPVDASSSQLQEHLSEANLPGAPSGTEAQKQEEKKPAEAKSGEAPEEKKGFSQYILWIAAGALVAALLFFQFVFPVGKQYDIIKFFIIFGLSIFIIIKSADYLVEAIQDYAGKTQIPNFLVGFVIISLATTFPDISAGIFAALDGAGELILGDAFSQVFVDVTVLIGLTAIIAKRVSLEGQHLELKSVLMIFGFLLVPLFFSLDGRFERWEGGVLIGLFIVYMLINTWKEMKVAHIVKNIEFKKIWQDIIVFGVAFGAILMAARWMVTAANGIAEFYSISPFVVGLILIGFGNALPEITFTINTVKRGIVDMGIGNSIGSIVVNVFMIIGVAAATKTLTFNRGPFMFSYLFMLGTIVLFVMLLRRKEITWKHGVLLMSIYLVFLLINLFVIGGEGHG